MSLRPELRRRVTDYTTVTETPGVAVTRGALDMVYTRYRYALGFCAGKSVLEVGCGAGQGLGYLRCGGAKIVGGDYSAELLQITRAHYGGELSLVRLDAHALPFMDAAFDVVILYEAIYYLREPARFVQECKRVLRSAGVVLICTVNPQWRDFNPSPFSVSYPTAQQLSEMLSEHRFSSEVFGAFPTVRTNKDWFVSLARRAAVALNLIPRTMKGKQLLKRLFLGRLYPMPAEISDGFASYHCPVSLDSNHRAQEFKLLFAIGRLPDR
jgi:SAM-dependent methyltransferase